MTIRRRFPLASKFLWLVRCWLAPAMLTAMLTAVPAGAQTASHAFALHGQPKYGPQFDHFDYVNPDAPKGGRVKLAEVGGFDSLNPFILRGVGAGGMGLTFDTLMEGSADEPSVLYGLVAETITVDPKRTHVIFDLNPKARFHDGSPILAADILFTFTTLKEKGHPLYRNLFQAIPKAEVLGPRRIKFHFNDPQNRELPLIIAGLPALSKKYFDTHPFDQTTLEAPLGSGPYKVKSVDQGRAITFVRVQDYWARDLPVMRGRYNFDEIHYDYYRDTSVVLEAFKAGAYDLRAENISKNWATAYNFPAVRDGRVIREEIPHQRPTGMQAFFMNTRRPLFADPKVRRALIYAFDFEWSNKHLFYDAYARTKSFFSNTELAATGLPSPAEIALLEPWRDQLPPEVFTAVYDPPASRGDGFNRDNLLAAQTLLQEAGWRIKNNQLVNAAGQPFAFDILLQEPIYERLALPLIYNLKKLGISARIRTVDSSQYIKRMEKFDYDMAIEALGQSLSPGNEQRSMWTCAAANTPGSYNYAGICSPAVDALIEKIIQAPDRQSLITRTQALDRVLLWGHYVIPQLHIRHHRIAYWNKFARPETTAPYSLGFLDTWWMKEAETVPKKSEK